jgi:hypothetical protein
VVDVPGLERWLRKVETPAELCSNEDSAVLEARRKKGCRGSCGMRGGRDEKERCRAGYLMSINVSASVSREIHSTYLIYLLANTHVLRQMLLSDSLPVPGFHSVFSVANILSHRPINISFWKALSGYRGRENKFQLPKFCPIGL